MPTSAFNRAQLTYPQAIKNICDFRLTLVSVTPIMTTTQTGITTVYMTPYKGNEISLYDGTNWQLYTTSEISLSLAGLTASKNYDIWCYNNGGTPTLEALVWTNDTTRATALTLQDGVYVKTGATTRRYIGTIRINATGGQCNYIFGALAANGTAGDLGVWNYYNRVSVVSTTADTTDSWTYSTATWRASNNSTTMRCSFLYGVAEDTVSATFGGPVATSGALVASQGVGYDVTNAFSGSSAYTAVSTASSVVVARAAVTPTAGYHYLSGIEEGAGSGTQTFYGDIGDPTKFQNGLIVNLFM